MDESISTAALTSLHPDQDDPDVAKVVYAGREFMDNDAITKFGDARPHQANILKFVGPLSSVTSQAIFWPTGRGKGWVVSAIAKELIALQRSAVSKSNRILIIVKDSVRQTWLTELSKYDEFTTAKIRDPKTNYKAIKGKEKAISSAIGKTIKILSLDAFALEIMTMKPEAIRIKYSSDMVVIDEAHFLRVSEEVSLDDIDDLKIHHSYESKIAYLMMHKFFKHAVVGLKIITTATPMYNSPIELVSIMSFVLPPEKRMTIAEFDAALKSGEAAMRKYLERLRGYVTFIPDNIGLSPIYDQGKPFLYLDDGVEKMSTIKIVECPMLPEQEAVYLAVLASQENDKMLKKQGLIEKRKRPGAFESSVRQALTFVFIDPNNHFRNSHKGFEYFNDPGDSKNSKDGFVRLQPPKRMTTAQKEQKALDKKNGIKRTKIEVKEEDKVTKFYFRYGRDLFKDCPPRNENLKAGDKLDEQRLQVIRRMSARFAKIIEIVHYDNLFPGEGEMAYYYNPYVKAGGGILLGMCFYEMGYDVFSGVDNNPSKLDERPRFAYMTGDPGSTAARSRNVRTVANDPTNAFGEKIKIIIGSETTAVGVSFTNARKMIHNGGVFTLPRQPEGRTNRTDSHRNFKEERQKFVRRYYMACTMGDGSQTRDHKMWWKVQEKEAGILPTENILSEITWNAGLNNGEMRKKFEGITTDFTRYHMHYAAEEYAVIGKKIRGAFQIQNQWCFEQLQALMGFDHRPDTLCWALRGMLDKCEILTNRFGFMKVLRENNGIYFLADPVELLDNADGTTHASTRHNLFEASYCESLTFQLPIDFRTISAAKLEEVTTTNEGNKQDMTWWDNSDAESAQKRMFKLEQALLGKIKDEALRKFILKDLSVTWFQTGDYYFHYIDDMRPKGNEGAYQFNRVRIDGKKDPVLIRIAKKGDTAFRPATKQETATAVSMINARWKKQEEDTRARNPTHFSIMKLVSSDREYRFRDYRKDIYKKNGDLDLRGPKGLKAAQWDPNELIEILYECDVANEQDDQTRNTDIRVKTDIVRGLGEQKVADWPMDKMRFFHGWLFGIDKVGKDKLIAAIVEYAIKNDFLIKK